MKDLSSPILITGCARSGTSMVAGAIHLCGAFRGVTSGPNENNKKGMFENIKIRQQIVKTYLKGVHCDKLGQYPLPDIEKLPIPNDWQKQVEQIMIDEGYKSGPWMYKGAKLCLLWPIWHFAFPDAKWIIVRRRTGDIARSCCNTGFMRAFSKADIQRKIDVNTEYDGWVWWVRQHEKRFVEMIEAGLNCKVVWPERMIDNDFSQMMETIEWCGLKWDDTVLSFISPKFWKTRRKKNGNHSN